MLDKYLAVARAVASVSPLMEYLLPCVKRGGAAMCWKGPDIAQEADAARKAIFLLGGKARQPIGYEVPNRDWQHNLFIVDKVNNTPKTYPRKAGTPSKNPLQVKIAVQKNTKDNMTGFSLANQG